MIFKAGGTLEVVQAKHKSVMAMFERKLEMKRVVLDKQQEDIKAIANTISSMKWRIVKLVAKNVACKAKMLAIKGAKAFMEVNLDAQRKELTDITGKLSAAKGELETTEENIAQATTEHQRNIDAIAADTARVADETESVKSGIAAKKKEHFAKKTELGGKESEVEMKELGV